MRQWSAFPPKPCTRIMAGPSSPAHVYRILWPSHSQNFSSTGAPAGGAGRAEGDGDGDAAEATRADASRHAEEGAFARCARTARARALSRLAEGTAQSEAGMRAEATDPADMSTVAANGVGAASEVHARRYLSRCESHQLRTRHQR